MRRRLRLARTFFLRPHHSFTLSPGNDCKGRSVRAGLQEGQTAGEELRVLNPGPLRSPDPPCLCPLQAQMVPGRQSLSQVTYPPSASLLPLPLLICNLHPPKSKSFLSHTPLPSSDLVSSPRSGLLDERNRQGRRERALENNRSQLSLIHLASYFPSKKELSFEH